MKSKGKGDRKPYKQAKKFGGKKNGVKKGGKDDKQRKNVVDKTRKFEEAEVAELNSRVQTEAPKRGQLFKTDESQTGKRGPALTAKKFVELPLSKRTTQGLEDTEFTRLTAIQRAAIPHALVGRDILGEAKTGSGKTLAFLIPVVEKLYRLRWCSEDGLGALVISPTRELAHQIFGVLRQVGKHHDLSAGCVVGGRNVEEEVGRMGALNIVVATPGRLLQHMEETPDWNADNLQVLVMDEADRILDLGFRDSMKKIVRSLPVERQTLLFSATLAHNVRDLATLSLRDPEEISVHADAKSATPANLKQHYMETPLEKKMDSLFSFLRAHAQQKSLIFVASCKEVRFISESFKKLKPGPAVMELHGRMSLEKRLNVFDQFTNRERAVALVCTDVAARGVDFPSVDWVIQMDCPENVATYIHRVGRTARYNAKGHSLLFLCPSERAFLQELEKNKIVPTLLGMNSKRLLQIGGRLRSLLAEDANIKHLAQKAVASYARSVVLMPNKKVFDVEALPFDKFALSLGLATAPQLKLPKNHQSISLEDGNNPNKKKKNMSKLERLKQKIRERKSQKSEENKVEEDDTRNVVGDKIDAVKEFAVDMAEESGGQKLSKRERRRRQLAEAAAAAAATMAKKSATQEQSQDDDDLFVMKSAPDNVPEQNSEKDKLVADAITAMEEEKALSRPLPKIKKIRIGKDGTARVAGARADNTHQVFSESDSEAEASAPAKPSNPLEARNAFVERMRAHLAQSDEKDQHRYKKLKVDKKREKKAKQKRKANEDVTEIPDTEPAEDYEPPEIDWGSDHGDANDDFSDADSCASFGEYQAKKKRKLEEKSKKEAQLKAVEPDDLEAMALQALRG